MTATNPSMYELMHADAQELADLHQSRLVRFAALRGISEEKAIYQLLAVHRRGINMAQWLSTELGDDHEQYMIKCAMLGERSINIR